MTNNYDDDDNIDDLPASFLTPTTAAQSSASQFDDEPLTKTNLSPAPPNLSESDDTPDSFFAPDEARDFEIRLLEAVLFASSTPLSLSEILNQLTHLDNKILLSLLVRLQQDYAGRGVVLEESEGRWAFRTASDLSESLSGMRVEERALSRAAQETLSVIAYHQPITRPEIEAVRGVATSKGTIDTLLETGWIKPGRRRETPGRPLTWVTTPTFLDHFALETIMDLPGLDELKAAGLLDRRPASSITADLFDNDDADGDDVAAALSDDDIASADDSFLEQQG